MSSAYDAREEEWRAKARCENVGFSLFYPEDENGEPISDYEVKNEEGNPGYYCIPCPVRRECLMYAINNRIYDGVFGGVNESERKKMISVAVKTRRQESRRLRDERKQSSD